MRQRSARQASRPPTSRSLCGCSWTYLAEAAVGTGRPAGAGRPHRRAVRAACPAGGGPAAIPWPTVALSGCRGTARGPGIDAFRSTWRGCSSVRRMAVTHSGHKGIAAASGCRRGDLRTPRRQAVGNRVPTDSGNRANQNPRRSAATRLAHAGTRDRDAGRRHALPQVRARSGRRDLGLLALELLDRDNSPGREGRPVSPAGLQSWPVSSPRLA